MVGPSVACKVFERATDGVTVLAMTDETAAASAAFPPLGASAAATTDDPAAALARMEKRTLKPVVTVALTTGKIDAIVIDASGTDMELETMTRKSSCAASPNGPTAATSARTRNDAITWTMGKNRNVSIVASLALTAGKATNAVAESVGEMEPVTELVTEPVTELVAEAVGLIVAETVEEGVAEIVKVVVAEIVDDDETRPSGYWSPVIVSCAQKATAGGHMRLPEKPATMTLPPAVGHVYQIMAPPANTAIWR